MGVCILSILRARNIPSIVIFPHCDIVTLPLLPICLYIACDTKKIGVMMKNLLIIGGVAAGATAAARARRIDNDINITLLEAGADVSFANCGLPYYIGGDIEYRSSLILASKETFNEQYRVNVHTNTQALEIDRKNKTVLALNSQTGEKTTFPYDSLILAQGGKPVVPPLEGVEKDHVSNYGRLKTWIRLTTL